MQNFFDINTIKRLTNYWDCHHLTGCRCMTEVFSADPDLLTSPDMFVDVRWEAAFSSAAGRFEDGLWAAPTLSALSLGSSPLHTWQSLSCCWWHQKAMYWHNLGELRLSLIGFVSKAWLGLTFGEGLQGVALPEDPSQDVVRELSGTSAGESYWKSYRRWCVFDELFLCCSCVVL